MALSYLPWFLTAMAVLLLMANPLVANPTTTTRSVTQPTSQRGSTVTPTQPPTVPLTPTGRNPDPPPFDGKVVIDGYDGKSLVKVYNKVGSIVFRKEFNERHKHLYLSNTEREWVLLRSVQGLGNVIEVNQFLAFSINIETGGDNQLFWFEAGFLRNKAYPGKVVAMVPVESIDDGVTEEYFGLRLVDEAEGNDRLYWIYNSDKKTLENGYPADRYLIEVKDGNYTRGTPVLVNQPNGKYRQRFKMPVDPDAKKLEILDISFDLESAVTSYAPVSLYRMSNRNNSPLPNTIKINQEEIKTTETKKAFYWKNEFVISADATFDLGLPELSPDPDEIPDIPIEGFGSKSSSSRLSTVSLHIGAKFRRTVGKSSVTKNTEVQKWKFETPITVPPYSEVKFLMLIQQGEASVPFTAILRKGTDVWQETGTYDGVNSFGLDVSIDVDDLESNTFQML